MLDLAALTTPIPFDARAVDELSDAELDTLPLGVIALDDDGTVLRYNLYESRLARLDRNQVVGLNFFNDVAPCTRTEAFEGRFRAFTAAPGQGRSERFEFVFDFSFGAQEVVVELIRAATARRCYLLINRTLIAAPRTAIPVEQLAAKQRDLAPEEERRGVLRDDLERRFLDAPAHLFAALRATCDRLAPEMWQIFASEWGVQWGRRAAVDLDAAVLENGGRSLRELPMRELAGLVSGYLAERGWGALSFDFSTVAEGVLLADLERSALAEAAPRPPRGDGVPGHDLACHLVAGCLSGILSAVAGRRLDAREVACVAGGAPRCSLVVVAHERRAALDAALGEGTRGATLIRVALRRATRSTETAR